MTVEVNKLSASERKVADKYYVLDNFFFLSYKLDQGLSSLVRVTVGL